MFHGSSLQLITAISVTVKLHLHFLHLFLSGVYMFIRIYMTTTSHLLLFKTVTLVGDHMSFGWSLSESGRSLNRVGFSAY